MWWRPSCWLEDLSWIPVEGAHTGYSSFLANTLSDVRQRQSFFFLFFSLVVAWMVRRLVFSVCVELQPSDVYIQLLTYNCNDHYFAGRDVEKCDLAQRFDTFSSALDA